MADTTQSFLELSDEEIMKMGTPNFANVSSEINDPETKPEDETTEEGNGDKQPEANDEDEQKTQPEDNGTDDESGKSDKADEGKAKGDAPEDKQDDGKAEPEVKTEQKQEEKKADEKPNQTADEQLAALFAPIKANGRDHKIESIEEARQLISMGIGFNKKMGALKPGLKVLKTLQNNGIISADNKVDEEKLNFLMDLANKNPEAISKLIKDSGADPLDLGDEKATNYKPKDHRVSDAEMQLDGVLDELIETPTAGKTLKVVTEDWDAESKQFALKNPDVLRVINGHMESGVYDLISTQLDKERALGKYKGLSDIQAYQQVGDAMNAAGKFDHLFGSSNKSQQTEPVAEVVIDPKLKQAEKDEQRNNKRKAAGGAPQAAPTEKKADFNPLAMSDEDFANFKPKFS